MVTHSLSSSSRRRSVSSAVSPLGSRRLRAAENIRHAVGRVQTLLRQGET